MFAPTKIFTPFGEIRTGGMKYYYTRDHLGSVREVLDGNGNIVARYDYDPYGVPTQTLGTMHFDMLYTGHFYHWASGLYLAPYRAYNPGMGHWISRDPIGILGGMNLYGYVGNNPLSYFDILGLDKAMSRPGSDPVVLPDNADLSGNIDAALDSKINDGQLATLLWFNTMVKNKGPWDYKQLGPQFQQFGNFNFGATGAACGLPLDLLLRGAGYAQVKAGTSNVFWGLPTSSGPPYGDDPKDQLDIIDGFDWYNDNYNNNSLFLGPIYKHLN